MEIGHHADGVEQTRVQRAPEAMVTSASGGKMALFVRGSHCLDGFASFQNADEGWGQLRVLQLAGHGAIGGIGDETNVVGVGT